MNFSNSYIKRYLPVSLLASLVSGSLFGLIVAGIIFALNRQVHNPAEVGVLAYGIYLAYGLAGVIGGQIVAVFLTIFFDFQGILPSRSKYFANLTAVLLFFMISVLAFHFFHSPYYFAFRQQLKLYIFLGVEVFYIIFMPRVLSLLESLGNHWGRLWANKPRRSLYGVIAFMLYIIPPAILWVGIVNFNYSSAYSPLPKIQANKTGRKVVLVGWDGATWYVIDKLFKEGLMPNLKKMVDGGVSGTVKSTMPLTSVALWNSIITGKIMAEHGIMDFTSTYIPFTNLVIEELRLPEKLGIDKLYKRLNLQTKLISSRRRKVPALWDILSIAGYSVGSVGWWTTFPVNRVNGFMISDQFADRRSERGALSDKQKGAYIYPPDYYDKLINDTYTLNDLKRSDISPFMELNKEDERLLFIEQKCGLNRPLYQFAYGMLTDKGRSGLAGKMYRKFKSDFLTLYFGGLDPTQHLYWAYMEPGLVEWVDEAEVKRYKNVVPRYYRFLDEQLGELMDMVDDNTVIMLISDHGLLQSPSRAKDKGKHSLYGIFACYGKGIPVKKHIRTNIYEITPSLLKILGLPLADDMPGEPVPELFGDGVVDRRIDTYDFLMKSIKRDNSWDRVLNQAVDNRLRAMGYLHR